jgi:hypothetical protein
MGETHPITAACLRALGHERAITQERALALAQAPQWLTREQAAFCADASLRTIDRWRGSGILTARRASGTDGRRVLVSRDDLRSVLSVLER